MTFAFDRVRCKTLARRVPLAAAPRPTAFRICLNALRKSFVAFAVLLSACAAIGDEEVLWWQVGNPLDDDSLSDVQITTFHEGVKSAADLGVTEARIRVVGTDEYLMMASIEGDPDPAMPVPRDWYASVVSPYNSAAYSFAIELGNWDWNLGTWTMIATSETMSYTDLVKARHIIEWDGTDPSAPAVWNPTSYVIPEPSGGMLILVGFALLALRRRQDGGE